MSKKRILNIKPQEIVTDGRRSVQFRGSDGKMHALASSENGSGQGEPIAAAPAKSSEPPLILKCDYSNVTHKTDFTDGSTYAIADIIEMVESGKRVFLQYGDSVMTDISYNKAQNLICFSQVYLTNNQLQLRAMVWDADGLHINSITTKNI